MIKELKPHDRTRRIMVGDVPVGGGAPVAVQSMLNVAADDVAANLAQIEALAEAGCEIVRMAIPRRDCLDAFEAVCAASPLPVVADIHFDARIAIEAAARGAAKLRINPGNIGGLEATREVIAAAAAAGIPIRIGVNAGSLDDALAARDDLTLPEKLVASATEYVRFFEDECDFHDIVVSAKAHDVQTTIDTYRLLAAELPEVPLHIGVTEAGTAFQGIIKSAMWSGRSFGRGHRRHHAHLAHGRPRGGSAGLLDAARRTRFAPPHPRAHQLPHLRALPGEPHRAGAGSGRAPRYGGQAGESGGHGVCGKRAGGSRRCRYRGGLRSGRGRCFLPW